jgi:hypothetical protein
MWLGNARLRHVDQREGKDGSPGHRLVIQAGKEPLQTIRMFAGFGDADLATSQQVDTIWTVR